MLYFRTCDNKIVSSKSVSAAHKLISGDRVLCDRSIRQIASYMEGVINEIPVSQITESIEYSCLCDKDTATCVTGFSDDTVEIGRCGEYKSFDCWACHGVKIYFDDGTVIDVKYEEPGIWRVHIKKKGTAPYLLYTCTGDIEKDYIDIFYIDAIVVKTRKV